MSEVWQLQDAKSRFCELVDRVETGPMFVTRRGKRVAVIISEAEYEKLSAKETGILEFFRLSPLRGAFERDEDPLRSPEAIRDCES